MKISYRRQYTFLSAHSSKRGISEVGGMPNIHDVRRVPAFRDTELECNLQLRLNSGNRVWVIGDVHGHLGTLRALVHRLNLDIEDRIIILGDLIDKGPNSFGVVEFVRNHPQIIAIKGNHEQMAVQSLSGTKVELDSTWMAKGGASTWGSYIVAAKGDLHVAKLAFAQDCAWMADLPSHIILDKWRLVHAGYHPRLDMEKQDEKTLLWIRSAFYKHKEPLDNNRTVLFGHTPTKKFGKPGLLANSSFRIMDGRPAWIGMDSCAFNSVRPCLTAFELSSGDVKWQKTLKSEYWWINTKRRESDIAEHFGLAELRKREKKAIAAKEKARRRLAMAGINSIVNPPVNFRIVKKKLRFVEEKCMSSGIHNSETVINHAQ